MTHRGPFQSLPFCDSVIYLASTNSTQRPTQLTTQPAPWWPALGNMFILHHLYHHLQTRALKLQQPVYKEQFWVLTPVLKWEASIFSRESWRLPRVVRLKTLASSSSVSRLLGFPAGSLCTGGSTLTWPGHDYPPLQALRSSSSPASVLIEQPEVIFRRG